MLITIEAEVHEEGKIQPKEPVALAPGTRLLVALLGEPVAADLACLSEEALSVDWMGPEEDRFSFLLSQDDQGALIDAMAQADHGEVVDGWELLQDLKE